MGPGALHQYLWGCRPPPVPRDQVLVKDFWPQSFCARALPGLPSRSMRRRCRMRPPGSASLCVAVVILVSGIAAPRDRYLRLRPKIGQNRAETNGKLTQTSPKPAKICQKPAQNRSKTGQKPKSSILGGYIGHMGGYSQWGSDRKFDFTLGRRESWNRSRTGSSSICIDVLVGHVEGHFTTISRTRVSEGRSAKVG